MKRTVMRDKIIETILMVLFLLLMLVPLISYSQM